MTWSGDDALRPLILALEATSTHPIAAGFRRAWGGVPVATASSVEHTIGGGVAGQVDGHQIMLGSPRFIASKLPQRSTTPVPWTI